MDFVSDIPAAIAAAAHHGTSFVPERRARQEQDDYARQLAADYAELQTLCDTPEKLAKLEEEFERYRQGMRRRTVACLVARSRIMSPMITGPANFPTERNRKRCETERRRGQELTDFRERALQAIRRELCPELRPIMSGDADAVERLRAEIAEAEKWQEQVKADNAKLRKARLQHDHPELARQLAELEVSEWSRGEIMILAQVCPYHLKPYVRIPGYSLANNNANIRRMRERLAQVERAKATPDASIEGSNAKIEDCPSENRVRLFFPGKPAAEVRDRLKSSGFRWTPSLGCWQAYRNHRSMTLAKEIAGA